MRRVLVIMDVGLWIALNRHFAGSPDVQLSEAPTLQMGLDLAQVERPDLVVCSTESAGKTPSQLADAVRERGLRSLPVACVHDGTAPVAPMAPFRTCPPDKFLHTVDELLQRAPARPVIGARVDILAHVEIPSSGPGTPQRGFANLIELDERRLLLENDEALQPGDAVNLTFFLPAPPGGMGGRAKVVMACEILRARDEEKLLYVASVRKIDEETRPQLVDFLKQARSQESQA